MPRVVSLDADPLAEAGAFIERRSGLINWEAMFVAEVAAHAKTKALLVDARDRISALEEEVATLKTTVAVLVARLGGASPATSQNLGVIT